MSHTQRSQLLELARGRLHASHHNLLSALELAEDAHIFSLDGVIVWANSSAARMLGVTDRELLDDQPLDALDDYLDAAAVVGRTRQVAQSTEPLGRNRYLVRRRDGTHITAEASSLPFALDGWMLVFSSARDVSLQVADRKALERSEWSLRESQRIAHIGSWELDLLENKLSWSPEIYRMFGFDSGLFVPSYEAFLAAIHPDDREAVNTAYRRSLQDRTRYEITHRLLMPDGRVKHVHEHAETFYDEQGRPLRSLGTVQDVTERVEAEQRLRRERNFSAAVLEHMGGIVVVLDREGRIRGFNSAAEDLSGLRFAQVEGRFPWDVLLPGDSAAKVRREAFEALVQDPVRDKATYVNEWQGMDGCRRLIQWSNVLLRDESGAVDFMISLGMDITERKQAEDHIKQQLADKEVLLKEVHHRVKNNLQIVSSLLYLQAEQAADARVTALLKESRERVRAMALVHETLYHAGELARVDFRSYVERLAGAARTAYQRSDTSVTIDVEIDAEPLDLELAMPCGLIFNELLTNALKHAFSGRAQGKIRLALTSNREQLVLSVSDDGIGLQPSGPAAGKSLGMELVCALSAQLGGELTIRSSGGTQCVLAIPRASLAGGEGGAQGRPGEPAQLATQESR